MDKLILKENGFYDEESIRYLSISGILTNIEIYTNEKICYTVRTFFDRDKYDIFPIKVILFFKIGEKRIIIEIPEYGYVSDSFIFAIYSRYKEFNHANIEISLSLLDDKIDDVIIRANEKEYCIDLEKYYSLLKGFKRYVYNPNKHGMPKSEDGWSFIYSIHFLFELQSYLVFGRL